MSYPQFQPWRPDMAGQPAFQAPMMRASHTDRERAVDVLKAGFAEGRLSKEEYDARLTRLAHARTYADLHLLVSDLPSGPVPAVAPAPQQPVQQQQPYWPPPQPQPVFLPQPLPPNNQAAVGAAVCGILSPFSYGLTAIPAVVLGHKARARIRQTGERGDGLALTGLILGWGTIGVGAAILFLIAMIALLAR
jgi:hypothetical protein